MINFNFKAIWRYVNVNGGVPKMIFPEMQGIIWMIYALPLTSVESLDDAWELIQAEANLIADPELKLWIDRFLTYVQNTWFVRYRPADWNHATSVAIEHITNNAAGKKIY